MSPDPGPDDTIRDGIRWVTTNARDGVRCPCCNQHVQLYRRTLTTSMAWVLTKMYRAPNPEPGGWVNIPALGAQGGDPLKARFWGLIEKPDDGELRDDGSPRTGRWRLTSLGRTFVRCEAKVHKYAYVFNNHFYGFDGDLINIREALGTQFRYDELMGYALADEASKSTLW